MQRLLGTEIVVATANEGKVQELKALFSAQHIAIKSLRDFSGMPEIVENGATFAENALIKARTLAQALSVPVIADDSGLCVDLLDGGPGVYSARYAGEWATDEQNNRKLLATLHTCARNKTEKERQAGTGELTSRMQSEENPPLPASAPIHNPCYLSRARFVCALCLVDAAGHIVAQAQGECEGQLICTPLGDNGFGYDPLFYLPEYGQTMAELSSERKNTISHRARALQALWKALEAKS